MKSPLTKQSFAPGQVIAHKYELMRLIGEGGMGVVFEARHQTTFKRCAAKVLLNADLVRSEEVLQRFFREARASSMAESEHIVQVFDSGFDPQSGCPYMILELLDGEDLDETIQRLGAINPTAAAKLVLQASMGLARAHEKGIVHRDIKPANLFLCRHESGSLRVKLLDFGIAKVIDGLLQNDADSHGLTRTGSMLGTPLYMSPEQAKGASRVDAQADVWSLGVALYQFLSGRLPFDLPESLGELMVAIITKELTPLQDVAPWITPELAEVTERAISRDLGRRYRDAGEFRDALSAILPDGPELMPEEMVSVPTEQRALVAPRLELTTGVVRAGTSAGLSISQVTAEPKPTRRRNSGLIVGVLVVLLGGLSISLLWLRSNVKASPTAEIASDLPVKPPASALSREHTYSLTVEPADALVEVDGEQASLTDGTVGIQGPLGATRRVVVRKGDQSIERVVAIAGEGLVPDKVALPAPSASAVPSSTPPAAKPSKRQPEKTGAQPAASKSTKSQPTAGSPKPKEPQLANDTSEFQ